MSFAALNWAVELPLKAPEKPVMIALANYADEQNSCNPSVKRIAFIAGIHWRTASNVIARLVKDGWIAIIHLPGKRSRYVLAVGSKGASATPPAGDEGGLGAVLVVDRPRSNPETAGANPCTTATPVPRPPLYHEQGTHVPRAGDPCTTARTVHKITKDYEGRKGPPGVRGGLTNETNAAERVPPGERGWQSGRLPSAVRQAVMRNVAGDWAGGQAQPRRQSAQLTPEQLREMREQAAKQRVALGLPPITYGNH